MINMRQLEAFRAVMDYGSVTRAGQDLYISQPAVTRLIHELEARVGFPLFAREHGRLTPTAEGLALYDEVQNAFVGLERITRAALEIREFRTGSLLICSMPAVAHALLPQVVVRYSDEYPGITLSLQVHSSQRVATWVATQQCDIGVVGMDVNVNGVVHEKLATAAMKCVLNSKDDLVDRKVIKVTDLHNKAMVSLGQSNDVRLLIEDVLRKAKVRPRIRIRTQLSSTACELVMAGAGAALVDPLTAIRYEDMGLLVKDFEPDIPFTYTALFPAFKGRSRLADEFALLLRSELIHNLSNE